MTLSQQIGVAVAERLARGGLPGAPLRASAGAECLEVDAEVVSEVGVRGNRLTYRSGWSFTSAEELRAWSDALSQRITYLTEPLALIELDAADCDALLRSRPPLVRAGTRAFFEGRVNQAGEFSLQRRVFDESSRESQVVPFQLTLEMLQHLAEDLEQTTRARGTSAGAG